MVSQFVDYKPSASFDRSKATWKANEKKNEYVCELKKKNTLQSKRPLDIAIETRQGTSRSLDRTEAKNGKPTRSS